MKIQEAWSRNQERRAIRAIAKGLIKRLKIKSLMNTKNRKKKDIKKMAEFTSAFLL